MKRLTNRLRRKPVEAPASRITNETVAEHREMILAGGRKFKYPIQYTRYKLVINALLVVSATTIILLVLGWWQLYYVQNSSTFFYRLASILPVPVAVVNGEQVRFSDYLNQYKGSEYYLSKYDDVKRGTSDSSRQLNYIKRESLDKAIGDTYARQIARQKGISVTEKDVDALVDQQRNTANGRISQETYDASSLMMYGWSPRDYRLALKHSLLRTRVAFAVDDDASNQVKQAAPLVTSLQGDFAKVAEQLASLPGGKMAVGQTPLLNNTSTSGGLQVSLLANLQKGQVSGALKSTTDDGYYFVKILDKNETQTSYSYLHIPLTTFEKDLAKLKKDGKIQEYIKVEVK
ncbi:MAG: SurA N-terminal domain-containing protein [Candidatus Saccharimonas sp.]